MEKQEGQKAGEYGKMGCGFFRGWPARAFCPGKQPLFNGLLRLRWPIGNSSKNRQADLQIPHFVN